MVRQQLLFTYTRISLFARTFGLALIWCCLSTGETLAQPGRVEEEVKVEFRALPNCEVYLEDSGTLRPLGRTGTPIWVKPPVVYDSGGRATGYSSGALVLQAPGHSPLKVQVTANDWTRARFPETGQYYLKADSLVVQVQDYLSRYTLAFVGGGIGALLGAFLLTRWRRRSLAHWSEIERLSARAGHSGDPLIGQNLGGYAVQARLGQGGMGAVYLVRNDVGDFAAKVVYFEDLDSMELARFRREFQLLRSLQHATFPRVFDYGETPGMAFVIMDLVAGQTLRAFMKPQGLPWAEIRPWILQILEGLSFAHAKGVVHRDLKPENIMSAGTQVKILDFGLARSQSAAAITKTGNAFGTPTYVAPEQITSASHDVDPRSDLYSFGILLFELLSGQPPFCEEKFEKLMAHHVSTPAPRLRLTCPQCPSEVDDMVAKLLEKRPENRPPSAVHVLDIFSNCH